MPVLVGLWELRLQQGCLLPSPMLLPFPPHFSSSALEAVPTRGPSLQGGQHPFGLSREMGQNWKSGRLWLARRTNRNEGTRTDINHVVLSVRSDLCRRALCNFAGAAASSCPAEGKPRL